MADEVDCSNYTQHLVDHKIYFYEEHCDMIEKIRSAILQNRPDEMLRCLEQVGNFNVGIPGKGDVSRCREVGNIGLTLVSEEEIILETPGGFPTPLILATQLGKDDIVIALLNCGQCDVNSTDRYGKTALHYAVAKADTNLINILLNSNCNPEDIVERNPQRNALMTACNLERENIELINILLRKSSVNGVNYKNEDEETPLALASLRGHCQIVKALINYGASVNIVSVSSACHPLVLASKAGHLSVAEMLIENISDDEMRKQVFNFSLISSLESFDNIKMLQFLINSGADVDCANTRCNWTPVVLAAQKKFWNSLNFLLTSTDCKLEVADQDGCTPLHLIVKSCSKIDCVKNILERKDEFNIDTREPLWQNSPLHTVLERNIEDIALIDDIAVELYMAGCSPFLKNVAWIQQRGGGVTPLEMAVRKNIIRFVKRVLSHQTDEVSQYEDPENLLHIAIQQSSFSMILCIINSGVHISFASPKQSFLHSALNRKKPDQAKVVLQLLNAGCNVSYREEGRLNTPLQEAMNRYKIAKNSSSDVPYQETIEVLVQHGADVNAFDSWYGETPVQQACSLGSHYLLSVFLSSRNATLQLDGYWGAGKSPLHIAASEQSRECIKLLLSYDPEIINVTNDGNRAVETYVNYKHLWRSDIIELLLEPDYAAVGAYVGMRLLKYALEEKYHLVPVVVRAGAPLNMKIIHDSIPLAYTLSQTDTLYLQVSKYLVQAGSPLHPIQTAQARHYLDKIVENGSPNAEIAAWLLNSSLTPRKLVDLCRISTRVRNSAPCFKNLVKKSVLPKTLKDFLLLKDIKSNFSW